MLVSWKQSGPNLRTEPQTCGWREQLGAVEEESTEHLMVLEKVGGLEVGRSGETLQPSRGKEVTALPG